MTLDSAWNIDSVEEAYVDICKNKMFTINS